MRDGRPLTPLRSASRHIVEIQEDDSMNERWHRHVVLALVLGAILVAPFAHLGRGADAQEATPVGAPLATPLATPVPGAQTWHVLVNNVSPDGENWSFNSFYPDHLRVHPGDAIVFTLAPNPNAFHTVMVLNQDLTPLEMYEGFAGGFVKPLDPSQPDRLQSTYFSTGFGLPPCGRAGQDPCLVGPTGEVEFGVSSAVLVNPPPGSSQANTSFTVTVDPAAPLGPYIFTSLVDGPTMSGWVDVVAPDQPVQSGGELAAAAQRQYEADLAWLASHDRVTNPPEASNPDGTKTWQVAAGGGSPDNPRLSINEFSLAPKVVHAGDTVTWTNRSPGAVAHTVSGFASTPDAIPQDLSPYQPGCMTSSGDLQLPPPGSFPPDIWNTCPGAEVNNLTEASQPSAPSGDPYTEGERTSGILLPQEYLDSPIGDGLPYASSYSITFPNPGTYAYHCAIHPGMIGTVIVLPPPMAG
jgi:plastocyanin